MKKYIMENGIKLIYEHKACDITSFCIGFNAGALNEQDVPFGTAHVVEHMLFKGTKNASEYDINSKQDEVFGFCNAMTNYPYAIYYGTTLSSDFDEGFGLYADIVLNPTFPQEGFKEEMEVIRQELTEWKEDLSQACEDEMFLNAFNKRRIKELIIGSEDSLDKVDIDTIKKFYNMYYTPQNCVISVVSSRDFPNVLSIVNKYFKGWQKNKIQQSVQIRYEENNSGVFVSEKKESSGAKIHYCFPIDKLDKNEIIALNVFNLYFGNGTSSLLYDELRTKAGIVYDVCSRLKNETGIKLFTIELGTSTENISRAMELVEVKIEEAKNQKITETKVKKLFKNLQLRRDLSFERTIQMCKNITAYEIMYGDCEMVFAEVNNNDSVNGDKIISTIKKVLKNPTIQILKC